MNWIVNYLYRCTPCIKLLEQPCLPSLNPTTIKSKKLHSTTIFHKPLLLLMCPLAAASCSIYFRNTYNHHVMFCLLNLLSPAVYWYQIKLSQITSLPDLFMSLSGVELQRSVNHRRIWRRCAPYRRGETVVGVRKWTTCNWLWLHDSLRWNQFSHTKKTKKNSSVWKVITNWRIRRLST